MAAAASTTTAASASALPDHLARPREAVHQQRRKPRLV